MKSIIKELWHGNIIPGEDSRNRPKQRSGKAEFVFIRRIPLAVYCVIRRVRPTNSKLCDGGEKLERVRKSR